MSIKEERLYKVASGELLEYGDLKDRAENNILVDLFEAVVFYVTTDGSYFTSYDSAMDYQSKLDLIEAISDDPIMGDIPGSYVKPENFFSWLSTNSKVVLNYLKSIVEEE